MDSPSLTNIIGMAWYQSEHYGAIRRIMSDSHKLPATFHEWRMQADIREKQERRLGKIVVRANIDPETFPDWCRSRGLNIDAQARMQYAATIAHETVMRSHAESDGHH